MVTMTSTAKLSTTQKKANVWALLAALGGTGAVAQAASSPDAAFMAQRALMTQAAALPNPLPNPLPESAPIRVMDTIVVPEKDMVLSANREWYEIPLMMGVQLPDMNGMMKLFPDTPVRGANRKWGPPQDLAKVVKLVLTPSVLKVQYVKELQVFEGGKPADIKDVKIEREPRNGNFVVTFPGEGRAALAGRHFQLKMIVIRGKLKEENFQDRGPTGNLEGGFEQALRTSDPTLAPLANDQTFLAQKGLLIDAQTSARLSEIGRTKWLLPRWDAALAWSATAQGATYADYFKIAQAPCEGQARMFVPFAVRAGLPTFEVRGFADESPDGHAVDIISLKLNGNDEPYLCDVSISPIKTDPKSLANLQPSMVFTNLGCELEWSHGDSKWVQQDNKPFVVIQMTPEGQLESAGLPFTEFFMGKPKRIQ